VSFEEQAGNFPVTFVVSLLGEGDVAVMGIAFPIEGHLEVINRHSQKSGRFVENDHGIVFVKHGKFPGETRPAPVFVGPKPDPAFPTIAELAPYLRGWRGYFGFCETPDVLIYLTRWVRLRLRAALWRQWKTPRRRRAALLALGVRPRLASHTAGSGRGPWYLARAKALSVGLSNAYFKSLGLPTLIDGC
jgi:hypothetical protein